MATINGFTPGMKIWIRTQALTSVQGEFVGWLPNGLVWRSDGVLRFAPTHQIKYVTEFKDE